VKILSDINTPVEPAPCKTETEGPGGGAVRIIFRSSLNRGCPPPLWQRARVHALNFHHADIERAHWNKIWRSMYEE
jgi:hypothetical protein